MKVNKVLTLGILVGSMIGGVAQASDLAPSEVPENVRKIMSDMYPNAQKVEWDYDKDDLVYEVDLQVNKQDVELKITKEGLLVEGKEDKTVDQIPESVKHAILNKYAGAKLLGANRLIKPEDEWWDVGLRLENGDYKNVYCRADGSDLR